LSPGTLDRLGKIYKPPRFFANTTRRKKNRKVMPILPRLLLAQLKEEKPPQESEDVEEKGMRVAQKKSRHGRSYVIDDFWWTGKCSFQVGDKVIQVTEDERGCYYIDPPADVLHRRSWHRANRPPITFVYFEHPDKRRIRLERLARRIGYGSRKRLKKAGIVRDPDFAEKLLAIWR
jgi:hypothetical protein